MPQSEAISQTLSDGKRHGSREVKCRGKAVRDRERAEERLYGALAFDRAAVANERVQLCKFGDMKQRRRESFLHRLKSPLDGGLLVAVSRHADSRHDDIMTCECRVSGTKLAFTSEQDEHINGLRSSPNS